jgi:hypothetical protein
VQQHVASERERERDLANRRRAPTTDVPPRPPPPSLHASIICQSLQLLEADECFLLVRGGGGGSVTGGGVGSCGGMVRGDAGNGVTKVATNWVQESLLADRWSRFSSDGLFVEGKATGEA